MTDFWREKPVLVTGGTGLLGSWLTEALVERGAHVVVLMRDRVPYSRFISAGIIERVITVDGSLQDQGLLRRTLCEYSVETVFHLAAQPLVGVAKLDPVGTLEANVQGTWNLLEAARHSGVRQIVVASSDKAYGPPTQLPYLEDHPLQGKYPYDVSKSCVDLICGMYAVTYGLPVAVTRCGNLFGGGDLNFSRTIPGLIRSTLRGERFVIRSDGRYVRDFLYVRDAAEAYLRLAELMGSRPELTGEAFNFSLEVPMTVLALVEKILGMMQRRDLEPVIQNTATAEIREQYLSAEKARRVLGWSPTYGLDRGLHETIVWYRKFFGSAAGETALMTEAVA